MSILSELLAVVAVELPVLSNKDKAGSAAVVFTCTGV